MYDDFLTESTGCHVEVGGKHGCCWVIMMEEEAVRMQALVRGRRVKGLGMVGIESECGGAASV